MNSSCSNSRSESPEITPGLQAMGFTKPRLGGFHLQGFFGSLLTKAQGTGGELLGIDGLNMANPLRPLAAILPGCCLCSLMADVRPQVDPMPQL